MRRLSCFFLGGFFFSFTFFHLRHMTPQVLVRLPGDRCYGPVTVTMMQSHQCCRSGWHLILLVWLPDGSIFPVMLSGWTEVVEGSGTFVADTRQDRPTNPTNYIGDIGFSAARHPFYTRVWPRLAKHAHAAHSSPRSALCSNLIGQSTASLERDRGRMFICAPLRLWQGRKTFLPLQKQNVTSLHETC